MAGSLPPPPLPRLCSGDWESVALATMADWGGRTSEAEVRGQWVSEGTKGVRVEKSAEGFDQILWNEGEDKCAGNT